MVFTHELLGTRNWTSEISDTSQRVRKYNTDTLSMLYFVSEYRFMSVSPTRRSLLKVIQNYK